MNPEDLRYADSHEWVRVEGDVGTIGITDHAQKQLGEIVYLELPEVGHMYDAGDEFGTVESVKAVSELFSPVTGEVVERNDGLNDNPQWVNDSPYDDGWMLKVRLANTSEVDALMTSEEYAKFLEMAE